MVVRTIERHLILVTLALGLVWARSSYGKLTSGNFSEGFASTILRFAGKNPYVWYKNFLENYVIPNSGVFSFLVMWGEILTALALVGASIFLLVQHKNRQMLVVLAAGLFSGTFLNLVFWLAAGWTSPSTDSLNLLMLAIEIIILFYTLSLLRSQKG